MPKQPTKTSTPRLSDVARHVAVPTDIVSTGWPAVERKCRELGLRFRWWQRPIGQIILAKRADGLYASTVGGTGLSIPRQSGKTFLVAAIVFALCLLRPNLTVIWTAHRVRTAEETFKKLQAFAKRKRIAPHISKVVLGSGEESIEFNNGSRIMFGARATGFGRGFDEVDVLIFDEAQILTEGALDDMVPATNQSRQETSALLLFMGTPPRPTDPGEVFTRMRSEALSGEDTDTGWVEFGADAGYQFADPPADLTDADWEQITKANPSFPDDTPRVAILRMRKKLGGDSFRREGAGIWDEVAAHKSVIPTALWETLEAEGPSDGTKPDAIAVDASHDGIPVVAACWRIDEQAHVELLGAGEADDEALADWLAEKSSPKIPVVIDGASPAARLIPLLTKRRVKVVTGSSMAMSKACGGLQSAVMAGLLTWGGPNGYLLGRALAGAQKRKIGDAGGWGWDRRDPDTNISPLVAVTLAHYGAANAKKRTGSGRSNGDRRAVSV